MSATGRLFKCVSKLGAETLQARKWLKIGEIYEESETDIFGQNENDSTTILVYANRSVPMELEDGSSVMFKPCFYVCVSDFRLVTTNAMYLN